MEQSWESSQGVRGLAPYKTKGEVAAHGCQPLILAALCLHCSAWSLCSLHLPDLFPPSVCLHPHPQEATICLQYSLGEAVCLRGLISLM